MHVLKLLCPFLYIKQLKNTGQIVMKFDVDWFYRILSTYVIFIENPTQLTDTMFITNLLHSICICY